MVLDWFLLEGGHPLYESPPDDGEVQLNPGLYEVRFPDLEVFVGPPTEDGPWVVDVAASVRPAIPLEVDTVESLIASNITALPRRYAVEIFAMEDFGSESSVWVSTRLTADEVTSPAIDDLLTGLLERARALQSHLS